MGNSSNPPGGRSRRPPGSRRPSAGTSRRPWRGCSPSPPGDCAEAVRLVLGRWEVQAVKTILRGKVSGASPAEILSSLVPTGLHDEAALEEMCRQADPRALAELMVTWREPWGRPLLRALPEYREPRDLAILESALDRCWFEQAAKRLREIRPSSPGADREDALSLFVSLSVDTTNLMTVLKEVEDRIVPANRDRYLLPGGRILDRERPRPDPGVADARGSAPGGRKVPLPPAPRDPAGARRGRSLPGRRRTPAGTRAPPRVAVSRARRPARLGAAGILPAGQAPRGSQPADDRSRKARGSPRGRAGPPLDPGVLMPRGRDGR